MTIPRRCDVLLVGGGIMGATLASLLRQLEPGLELVVLERLPSLAAESGAAMNNAGTGHAANCELNYTPEAADGSVPTGKALAINASFERSLELWSSLVEQEVLVLLHLSQARLLHMQAVAVEVVVIVQVV